MASLNQITLIGNMGKDPQLSTTDKGFKVARFSLATTEGGYKTKEGKEIPAKTEWHDITLWRNLAEFAAKYAKKGMQVFVQGKLRHNSLKDKDGNTRYFTEIEATDFQILDWKNGRSENTSSVDTSSIPAPTQNAATNDDLPF